MQDYFDENKPVSDIAQALVAGRMAKGLTQKELASLAGIQQADISRYEKCEQIPTIPTLKRLADALDLKLCLDLVPMNTKNSAE